MAAVIDFHTGSRIQDSSDPELELIVSPPRLERIYLVRRAVAALVAVGVLMACAAVLWSVAAALTGNGLPTSTATHVVAPDETLWEIALAAQPDRDPRHTIAQIVQVNSTDQYRFDPWKPLDIGQEIVVPLDR